MNWRKVSLSQVNFKFNIKLSNAQNSSEIEKMVDNPEPKREFSRVIL
jgi:hypothetical protein